MCAISKMGMKLTRQTSVISRWDLTSSTHNRSNHTCQTSDMTIMARPRFPFLQVTTQMPQRRRPSPYPNQLFPRVKAKTFYTTRFSKKIILLPVMFKGTIYSLMLTSKGSTSPVCKCNQSNAFLHQPVTLMTQTLLLSLVTRCQILLLVSWTKKVWLYWLMPQRLQAKMVDNHRGKKGILQMAQGSGTYKILENTGTQDRYFLI